MTDSTKSRKICDGCKKVGCFRLDELERFDPYCCNCIGFDSCNDQCEQNQDGVSYS